MAQQLVDYSLQMCKNKETVVRVDIILHSIHPSCPLLHLPHPDSDNAPQQQPLSEDELPEPPGMFATIGAMGAGGTSVYFVCSVSFYPLSLDLIPPLPVSTTTCAAGGAVFIAALGVYAVFKMAFWVAGETGRSMRAEQAVKSAVATAATSAAATSNQQGGEEARPTAASPIEKHHAVTMNTPLMLVRRRLMAGGDGVM